jgi:hypothetical protein
MVKAAQVGARARDCITIFGLDHRCFPVEQISTVESHC